MKRWYVRSAEHGLELVSMVETAISAQAAAEQAVARCSRMLDTWVPRVYVRRHVSPSPWVEYSVACGPVVNGQPNTPQARRVDGEEKRPESDDARAAELKGMTVEALVDARRRTQESRASDARATTAGKEAAARTIASRGEWIDRGIARDVGILSDECRANGLSVIVALDAYTRVIAGRGVSDA